MNKSERFDDVLNDCLDRLLLYGDTVEQCLTSYPEHAEELKPLLKTAAATRQVSAIQPRPEFKARARYQFRAALREMESRRGFPLLRWLPQWAAMATMVLVFLVVAGSGTVVAAGNSMPDNPLYPVKLATEQVRLILTPSDMGKAEIYADLTEKRVAEIVRMADKGKPELVHQAAARVNVYLLSIAGLLSVGGEAEREMMLAPVPETMLAPTAPTPASPAEAVPRGHRISPEKTDSGEAEVSAQGKRLGNLKQVVKRLAVDQPTALRAALQRVPESARPALLHAIAISEAGYEKVLDVLE
ncbi:DUF5667 domain-containing protein [Chloroflexota bacterium]